MDGQTVGGIDGYTQQILQRNFSTNQLFILMPAKYNFNYNTF